MKLGKQDVYALDDADLVRALRLIAKKRDELGLACTRFESAFMDYLPERYVRTGSMTWKQRRKVREIVLAMVEQMQRSQYILGAEVPDDDV